MGRNNEDFIGSRHPDYNFYMYDNMNVKKDDGTSTHGHEVVVLPKGGYEELGRFAWSSTDGHIIHQYEHPDHPGLIAGMRQYAEGRYRRNPYNFHTPPQ